MGWLSGGCTEDFAIPETMGSYYEPFLGGGSVFFYLQPDYGVISDKNPELINFYEIVRDYPHKMKLGIQCHQTHHSKNYYYEIRDREPQCMIERAVRFLYLNRACWNGLYRVNRNGRFNVPIGTKQKVMFENDDFEGAARVLKKVNLRCADFEEVIDEACESDFVFIDPPYTVKHNLNGFVKYNDKIFSWCDQERLLNSVERAANRGCHVTVTNADNECIRILYRNANYKQISRVSTIAGIRYKRAVITEAIFTYNH